MSGDEFSEALAQFDGVRVRKVWHEERWFFSVVDVIAVLTESPEPRKYWNDMKRRDTAEARKEGSGGQLSAICRQLKMEAPDGKMRATDAADVESMFRIIQSIPSPKAEPFKMWLAKVGVERIQEERDPDLAIERVRRTYKMKGRPDDWIDKRIQSTKVRKELTDEWKARGAGPGKDYAALTDTLSLGTFGLTTKSHRNHKDLAEKHNLRDHMTTMEMVLMMLAEATSTTLHRDRDSRGMDDLAKDASDAGRIAGRTRLEIEENSGVTVVSQENFLPAEKKTKRLK